MVGIQAHRRFTGLGSLLRRSTETTDECVQGYRKQQKHGTLLRRLRAVASVVAAGVAGARCSSTDALALSDEVGTGGRSRIGRVEAAFLNVER